MQNTSKPTQKPQSSYLYTLERLRELKRKQLAMMYFDLQKKHQIDVEYYKDDGDYLYQQLRYYHSLFKTCMDYLELRLDEAEFTRFSQNMPKLTKRTFLEHLDALKEVPFYPLPQPEAGE